MPPYPLIDSLRIGRAHYLLIGVLVGIFFFETGEVFHLFEVVRYNCIGAILLWIGLQAGLSTDLQNLRNQGISVIYSQTAVVLATSGFTVLAAFASGSILYRYLGLLQNLPLTIVLLTCFALTARFPTPFFQWPNRPIPNPVPGQNLPLGNIRPWPCCASLFPPLAENPIFYLRSFAIYRRNWYCTIHDRDRCIWRHCARFFFSQSSHRCPRTKPRPGHCDRPFWIVPGAEFAISCCGISIGKFG